VLPDGVSPGHGTYYWIRQHLLAGLFENVPCPGLTPLEFLRFEPRLDGKKEVKHSLFFGRIFLIEGRITAHTFHRNVSAANSLLSRAI
jgi:hypothetical protein